MIFFCSCASSGTRLVENDFAERNQRPIFRPMNRCVVHDIVFVRDLDQDLKADRASPAILSVSSSKRKFAPLLLVVASSRWSFPASGMIR